MAELGSNLTGTRPFLSEVAAGAVAVSRWDAHRHQWGDIVSGQHDGLG